MVNKLLPKIFTIVIIFLLMVFSIFPISIGFSSYNDPFTISFEGTMGENGWYISPINVTIIINPEMCKEVGYNIGDGWQIYKEPFTISKEGRITFNLYWVDMEGAEHYLTFHFRIDMSPPTVKISKYPEYDHIIIDVDSYDHDSMIERLEFYLDDELLAVYDEEHFQWTYNGKEPHLLYVKAYNYAGLYNESEKISIRTSRFIYSNNYKLLKLLFYLQNQIGNILRLTTF
jgi:hypothetical protein